MANVNNTPNQADTTPPIEALEAAMARQNITLQKIELPQETTEPVEILVANIDGFIVNFVIINKVVLVVRVQIDTDRPSDSPDPSYYLDCVPINGGPTGLSACIVNNEQQKQCFRLEHELLMATNWYDDQLYTILGLVLSTATAIKDKVLAGSTETES
ncbi:MAG: hypothetical protein Q3972_07370 [Corynebacterium sp.]|nr:hypothetical protein [Corynebacterium sp.]